MPDNLQPGAPGYAVGWFSLVLMLACHAAVCKGAEWQSTGRNAGMPPVLIQCPFTEELVPTGAQAESLEALEADNLLIACPECGRDHEWTPADAVLAAQ